MRHNKMGYYKDMKLMRTKVVNTIRGTNEKGISRKDLIFLTLMKLEIGEKAVVAWIDSLITDDRVEEKNGVLIWIN